MKKLRIFNSGKPLKMMIEGKNIQLPDGDRAIGDKPGQVTEELASKIIQGYGHKCQIIDVKVVATAPTEEKPVEAPAETPVVEKEKAKPGRKTKK